MKIIWHKLDLKKLNLDEIILLYQVYFIPFTSK
jgi:hypothetical protein